VHVGLCMYQSTCVLTMPGKKDDYHTVNINYSRKEVRLRGLDCCKGHMSLIKFMGSQCFGLVSSSGPQLLGQTRVESLVLSAMSSNGTSK
jgi:hypothetical protein